MKSNIVKVVGRADSFDLIFNKCIDGLWAVTVPPDLSDGQYVCEIYATNESGETAYWTGMLYMADSRLVCLKLVSEKYTAYILPQRTDYTCSKERVSAKLIRRCGKW